MAGIGAHEIAAGGPQPLLDQYGIYPEANGTLTFELLGRDGGTIFAGSAALAGGAAARLVDVLASATGIGASLASAVGAVVSPSVAVRWNTGYPRGGGPAASAPSAASLSRWLAGEVYEIGWVG